MSVICPPDVLEALRAALLEDPTIMSLTDGRVFSYEMPLSLNFAMPAKCIVLRGAGGPGGPDTLQITQDRVNLQCWGETPHLAHVVYSAAYAVLKPLQPGIWAHTYIHGCIQGSGEIPFRDPNEQWPYSLSSWLVRSSDLSV